MPAKALKRNKVVPANIVGHELAVFRKDSGEVAALHTHIVHTWERTWLKEKLMGSSCVAFSQLVF